VKIRKPAALLALAGAASAIAVVSASAQDTSDVPDTDIQAHVKVTPNKAGSKGAPQGVRVIGDATLTTEAGFDPPLVTGVDILVGPGIAWNGGDYAKCAKVTLERGGPQACPKKSIMGTALATGMADTVAAHLKVTFVNGGQAWHYAYATLDNPARVQQTIPIRSEELKGGKWAHRERFKIPESLQVVAGVPIRFTKMRFEVGARSYARNYIATTSCPKGGWKYQATAHYLFDLTGQTSEDTIEGSVPCTS
jgi:hypothetical protein